MAAAAAVSGIREIDRAGSIGLIGLDPHPPYDRPPLSKGLWQDTSESDIWRDMEDLDVSLHLGRKVEKLDTNDYMMVDSRQDEYRFDKLLLATGGTPKRLPFGDEHIIYFRTLDNYRRLRALAETKEHFAVIGGSFIGAEITAALTMNDKQVTMLFPEAGIGGLYFPPDLAGFLNKYYRDRGVEVIAGEQAKVLDLESRGQQLALKLESGGEVEVDSVVAGIGIAPNTELAQAAGLEVADGIMVNRFLQTSHPDIYAAGDVASFYNQALDRRLRVEHEDNANTMGKMAGRAMAGEAEPYDYLPSFYSDLFDLGYEAVGVLDTEADIVVDWREQYEKGVIYYLEEGRVRGVLLWNVWDQVGAARQLIAEEGPFTADDLKGRI